MITISNWFPNTSIVPSWVVEWAPQILEWAPNFLCYVYAMKTEILKMINVFENALVANQRSFCHRWIEEGMWVMI